MSVEKHIETVNTLEDFFQEQTSISLHDIIMSNTKQYAIPKIHEVYNLVDNANFITVIGDYDVDGIAATAIIIRMLRRRGKQYAYRIPKRFSEGYGINISMIRDIPDNSLIITVDNGITCVDQVQLAKSKGCKVIILDHHKPNNVIPDADIILDPKYDPTGWDFIEYCGAGIAFRIALACANEDSEYIADIVCFAALATVADTVPLIGENRKIVKRGLFYMNSQRCPRGIRNIIHEIRQTKEIPVINADTIGYYIAPMLNAPGRIKDDGGQETSLPALLDADENKVHDLINYNIERKQLVEQALRQANPEGDKINFLYQDMCLGICGIVAQHIANDKKPSFVLTLIDGGIVKGSARSLGSNNIFDMLKYCEKDLLTFGGHAKAGAFSLLPENISIFKQHLEECAVESNSNFYYDLELDPSQASNERKRLDDMEPFGEGMRPPMYLLNAKVDAVTRMGKDSSHLKLQVGPLQCVAWKMADEYTSLGSPKNLKLYGYLENNYYKQNKYPQFNVQYMEL